MRNATSNKGKRASCVPAWARLERQTVQGAESCTCRGAGPCVWRPRTEGSMTESLSPEGWAVVAMVAVTLVLACVVFYLVQGLAP